MLIDCNKLFCCRYAAESAGFPKEVIESAREVKALLHRKNPSTPSVEVQEMTSSKVLLYLQCKFIPVDSQNVSCLSWFYLFCYRCCSVLELQSKTWFILLWMNREWELFLQTSNQRFVQLCIVWKENNRASFSTFEWWYTQRCKKWFAVVIITCWFVKFQTGFGLQKICGSKTDPTDIKNAIQPGKDT